MLLSDPPAPDDGHDGAGGDAATRASLLSLVHEAFPSFRAATARVEATGGDHLLLILDGDYAFRFPRAGMHRLDLELKLLARLQLEGGVATPRYDHVDPRGRFAGYRLIDGVPLTRQRFAQLPDRDDVLRDVARFLATLHGITPAEVAPAADWPVNWTAAAYADRTLAERLPPIASHFPALAAPLAAFCRRYRRDAPPRSVIVHGDLVEEHFLLDERTHKLAGIIDFGDVALGDPAQDFMGLWAYGDDAVAQCVALYGAGDPGLLDRSRHHFIRYRVDRLFEQVIDRPRSAATARQALELGALLG